MAASDVGVAAVTLGDDQHSITFEFEDYRVHVAFRAESLSGSWRTQFVQAQETALELKGLYESLKGKVLLSDDESIGVTFEAGARGQITAEVLIQAWPFHARGSIGFPMAVEHEQLLRLAKLMARFGR